MVIRLPKNCTGGPDMEFHEHLKKLRETKELTQLQMAEAIGIAKNTYIGYEKGSREPRLSELKKMAEIFSMGLSELCLESRNSGLSGWLKASFEAASKLRAKDKAALIQVVNGYVTARRFMEIAASGDPMALVKEAEEESFIEYYEEPDLENAVQEEALVEELEANENR